MIGKRVTFTSIYKLKMKKQGWFLFHQKNKLLEKIQNQKSSPPSEKKKHQFVTIAHINNESELYDIVSVTGIIYNLEPVETVHKNEKKITYEKLPCKTKPMTYPSQYLVIWLIKLIMKV